MSRDNVGGDERRIWHRARKKLGSRYLVPVSFLFTGVTFARHEAIPRLMLRSQPPERSSTVPVNSLLMPVSVSIVHKIASILVSHITGLCLLLGLVSGMFDKLTAMRGYGKGTRTSSIAPSHQHSAVSPKHAPMLLCRNPRILRSALLSTASDELETVRNLRRLALYMPCCE